MKPTLIVAFTLTACASAPASPAQVDPPFPTPGLPLAAHVYPVEKGWFNGQAVEYYNFGSNTPLNPDDPARVAVANVWSFVVGQNPDGSPIQLEGQHNIFDFDIGDAGYSDLWLPHFVTPPDGYAPDSITSAADLLASGFAIAKQPVFVNCPIVPPGSALAENDVPLKTAWIDGKQVVYFDFGATSARPGKVYAFVTGFDSNGNPQLVSGQHFVFDSTRTEPGYSDFWIIHWVIVDAAYQPDSVRAATDIQAEIRPSTLVVNYPHR
jgi:hypothetical protein